MAQWKRAFRKLVNLLANKRAEAALTREVAAHLTLLADDFERRGLSPEEARLAARRAYGGVEQAKQSHRDAREAAGDLAGHEGLAAQRRFVIEENAAAGVHAVGLAVVDRDPVGVELGDEIGRAHV